MYISLNFNEKLVEASGFHPILYVSVLFYLLNQNIKEWGRIK